VQKINHAWRAVKIKKAQENGVEQGVCLVWQDLAGTMKGNLHQHRLVQEMAGRHLKYMGSGVKKETDLDNSQKVLNILSKFFI
jgi:hypothetical protein